MFNVTDRAKELISVSLFAKEIDPDTVLRIKHSEAEPEKMKFTLDQERESDRVIKNKEGLKVLVINSDLANILSAVVLDVQNTSKGDQFVLTDDKIDV